MKTASLRAVGYRRVSMREQVDGFSLDAQANNIRQYAESQGWNFVELYTDAGISAKKDSHRPALEQLMTDAEAHRFDVVVVDKVDRFYRHLRGLLGALDQLNGWDIAFVSVQERLDFTTVWGKLTLTVLGTLAEIYIDNLRQETRKGKLQRARDGYWNGNIPYGYCYGLCSKCKDPNGEGYCPDFGKPDKSSGKLLVLHPIDSKVVRLIYDWYLSEIESDGHIAKRLQNYRLTDDGPILRTRGLPGQKPSGPIQKDSVRNMLTNIFYAGFVPYYGTPQKGEKTTRRVKEIFSGKHPALVTVDEFEEVQKIRQTLGKTPLFHRPNQSRIYPLSGLLHCSSCGRAMRGSSARRGEYLYRDTTRIEKSGKCCQDTVHAEIIEDKVAQWLVSELAGITIKATDLSLSEQSEKIQSRYDRAKTLFIADQIEKEFYESEKERYENGLALLQKKDNNAIMTFALEIRSKLARWQRLTNLEKRRLLQIAAEAVYIKGSVLVGVQPTFALLPLTTLTNEKIRVGSSGPDGIRTRDLGLDRAAC
jgi:site-specific DNA recombinase